MIVSTTRARTPTALAERPSALTRVRRKTRSSIGKLKGAALAFASQGEFQMRSQTVAFSLLVMTGCGGNVAPVEDVPADAAATVLLQIKSVGIAAAAELPYGRSTLPVLADTPSGRHERPARLPRGRSALPCGHGQLERTRCVPAMCGTGTRASVSPVPLDQIGAGLAKFQCLCQVAPLPRGAACPGVGEGASSTSSWCYAEGAEAPETIGCGGAAIIGLSDLPAPDATLLRRVLFATKHLRLAKTTSRAADSAGPAAQDSPEARPPARTGSASAASCARPRPP